MPNTCTDKNGWMHAKDGAFAASHEGSLYLDCNQKSLPIFNVYRIIQKDVRTRQTLQSLSPPSLYSILVNVFPPPRELPKKPLVTLHWGHPEVKNAHKYFTCPTGEEKKEALYLSGVLAFTRSSGGEKRKRQVTPNVYVCGRELPTPVNRQIIGLRQQFSDTLP